MSKHLSQTDINALLSTTPVLGTPVTITGAATSGGLINLLATAHGIAPGTTFAPLLVSIANVLGTVEANGFWLATVPDANHITLTGSVFTHAWASGGTITVVTFSGGLVAALTPPQLEDLLFSTQHTAWQPAAPLSTILAVAP